jgi:maltooligosyltrehalose trehalohydrolase
MSTMIQRRLPVGAEIVSEGGAHLRVWAPRRKVVEVVLETGGTVALEPEPGGYFSGLVESAHPGTLYRFRLDRTEPLYPDPAARYQPAGPHGPSQIVDSNAYRWTDRNWPGIEINGQILYEMHVGTFTREGTWNAAKAHLLELADVGVTTIEVMPVTDFPGRFGWGYDGVCLYAPTRLYGTPDEFKAFVDHAHSLGLGVILDVVYNHVGPDGNFLNEFSDSYFTTKYQNEWGEAPNFDGPDSRPVREFFTSNAAYWIDEFHIDGLRLDATQQMFDNSAEYIVAEIVREARKAAGRRSIVIVAEDETQRAQLAMSPENGGSGLDALWNDDFHHTARVAMTKRSEAYYSGYFGTPQEFISAAKWGYLFQGQYYAWQKKRRGTPSTALPPSRFITYVQNHDQIANAAGGERIQNLTSPALYRAITAIMFLSPATPMLFQGQEFGAKSPFHYFADHNPTLAPLVQKGRAQFMNQFASIADSKCPIPVVNDPRTFEACKIDHLESTKDPRLLALHRDLIRLRKCDPVFSAQRSDWMHGAVLAPDAFVLRFFGGDCGDRLIVVNLGRDLNPLPGVEPLMAPPAGCDWTLMWSSESPRYGGCGRHPVDKNGQWSLTAEATLVLESEAL